MTINKQLFLKTEMCVVAQGYCHSCCYSRQRLLLSDRKLNFMANMWRPQFHIIDGGKRHIFGPYSCTSRASYDAWRQELRFQFSCSYYPSYFRTILHYYYRERTGVAIFSARQSNVFLKYKKRGKLYCSNYCLDTETETKYLDISEVLYFSVFATCERSELQQKYLFLVFPSKM